MKKNKITTLLSVDKEFICKIKRVGRIAIQFFDFNNKFRALNHLGYIYINEEDRIKVFSINTPSFKHKQTGKYNSFVLHCPGIDKNEEERKVLIKTDNYIFCESIINNLFQYKIHILTN